ncbi:hypothetical protein IT575_13805 [bacterium]|nr:hypothetical protein [bacterium]
MASVEGSYYFEHLLTREAAYSALLEHNRRTLHRASAELLTARIVPGSQSEWELLPQLAAHLEAAAEWPAAHRRWCEVLRLAARSGHRDRCPEFSRRAEHCGRMAGAGSEGRTAFLLRALAAGFYNGGDFSAALRLLEEARELLPPCEQAELGGILLDQAQALHRMARIEEARPLYARALAEFETRADLVQQSEAQRGLGVLARDTYQAAEALARTEMALALARQSGSLRQELVCLIAMSNAVSVFSSAQGTLHYAMQALSLARELGDLDALATALQLNSEVSSFLGLGAEGLALGAESLSLARASGNRRTECLALQSVGMAQASLGLQAESRASLLAALGLSRQLGHKWGEMQVSFHLGDALALMDSSAEAQEYHLLASRLAEELGMGRGRQMFHAKAALWDLERGDTAAARQRLEGFDLAGQTSDSFWSLDVFYLLVRLEAQDGRLELARRWLERASELAREFAEYPGAWPHTSRRRALAVLERAEAELR